MMCFPFIGAYYHRFDVLSEMLQSVVWNQILAKNWRLS